MKMFIGVASYARPRVFKWCLLSLASSRVTNGIITAIDVRDPIEKDRYITIIKNIRSRGLEVIADISNERRGSTGARNRILDIAEQLLGDDDILVLYDDDYISPGYSSLVPASVWLKDKTIGLVGGRVVNLRKRSKDPDFYLNILPGLADTLTKLTGFVFLDTRYGPRYVDYTTPLMATRIDVIKKGIRYDPNYKGTSYREENDLQYQIRKLGYKIVYEPRFYVYHLCAENGGNRVVSDTAQRFYWKTHNQAYYVYKHGLGSVKLILSTMIILTYAMLYGLKTFKAAVEGFKEGLSIKSRVAIK